MHEGHFRLRIGTIGSGLMGAGIAELCARRGHEVLLTDALSAQLDRARDRVEQSLRRSAERGQASEDEARATAARIAYVADLKALAQCDLVIEAVTEDPGVKTALFARLDAVCGPEAVLASNTSSIPIVTLGAATRRPSRVVGLHFTNPVPRSRIVEVIPSIATSPETVQAVRAVASSLGLEIVECRDRAGFLLNLLTIPYLLDAIRAVQDGHASSEDVDRAMTLGMGYPIGPLALCDFVGLDTVLNVAWVLYDAYREPRYAPPTLLRQMVAAGWTGRKSGRGFYVHDAAERTS